MRLWMRATTDVGVYITPSRGNVVTFCRSFLIPTMTCPSRASVDCLFGLLGIGWFTSFSRRGRFEAKRRREEDERRRERASAASLQLPEAADLAPMSAREDCRHPQQVGEALSPPPRSADALL